MLLLVVLRTRTDPCPHRTRESRLLWHAVVAGAARAGEAAGRRLPGGWTSTTASRTASRGAAAPSTPWQPGVRSARGRPPPSTLGRRSFGFRCTKRGTASVPPGGTVRSVAGSLGWVGWTAVLVVLTAGCAGSRPPVLPTSSARSGLQAPAGHAPITGKEAALSPRAHPLRGSNRQVSPQQALAHAARLAAPACGPGSMPTPEHPVVCPR
jgi:hypothetical protein